MAPPIEVNNTIPRAFQINLGGVAIETLVPAHKASWGQLAYARDENVWYVVDYDPVLNILQWIVFAGGGGGSSPILYTVFVGKNGVDATADGSIGKPFLTVQAAMEFAWTTYVAPLGPQPASPFTRPCVFVSAGTYDDGPLVLPPQVCVMGEGFNHSRIVGDWTIDGRWTNYVVVNGASPPIPPGPAVVVPLQTPTQIDLPSGYVIVSWGGAANVTLNVAAPAGSSALTVNLPAPGLAAGDQGIVPNDMRSTWLNVGLFGNVDIDFAPMASNEGKIYTSGARFAGDVTINEKTINPVSNSLTATSCEFLADVTLGGIATLFEGCITKGGKLTLNQLAGTSVDNVFESSGGSLGEIHVNSLSALAPPYSCSFGHSAQPGTNLTLNGSFSAVNGDTSSIPIQSAIALAGGATLDQITRSNQPNWSGPTAARPTSKFVGLQYFDTDIGLPIWWNGAAWINAAGGLA